MKNMKTGHTSRIRSPAYAENLRSPTNSMLLPKSPQERTGAGADNPQGAHLRFQSVFFWIEAHETALVALALQGFHCYSRLRRSQHWDLLGQQAHDHSLHHPWACITSPSERLSWERNKRSPKGRHSDSLYYGYLFSW